MDWSLLDGVPEPDRGRLVRLMARRRYAAGETVFHEGDPADAVHFVSEGHVMVRRVTPDGEGAALTVLGPGQAFGELAMLSPGGVRTTSVLALEGTTTLVLHHEAFERLCRRHPRVNRLLVDLLAERVRRLSDHLLDALYAPVDERVVHRLEDLCRIYGSGQPTVRIPLTQTDLSEMAGASRPATNRVLQRLAEQDLVVLARGAVTVPDHRRLRSRSDGGVRDR